MKQTVPASQEVQTEAARRAIRGLVESARRLLAENEYALNVYLQSETADGQTLVVKVCRCDDCAGRSYLYVNGGRSVLPW